MKKLTFLIFSVDQVLKFYALKGNWPLLKNHDSFAFGLLPSYGFIPIILYSLGSYFLLRRMTKTHKILDTFIASFFVAGSLSNSVDRIFRGYVVDYIPFGNLTMFNLGDVSIIASLSLLSYDIVNNLEGW